MKIFLKIHIVRTTCFDDHTENLTEDIISTLPQQQLFFSPEHFLCFHDRVVKFMEKIQHKHVDVGELKLHVAEIGLDAGFHAIAPDYRGYGLSDQPSQIERVRGIITLGLPYLVPGQGSFSLDLFPPGFYVRHWAEPGRALADFGRFDAETVVRNIYTLFARSEMPEAEEGKEIMDLYDPATPLPSWFTESDLKTYSSLYEKSGFAFAMQVPYMSSASNWGKLAELTDYTIKVPAFLVMGSKDYALKFPGMEDYINSDVLKSQVPNLEIKFFPEGSHFVQEQFPEEVNKLVLGFLSQQL